MHAVLAFGESVWLRLFGVGAGKKTQHEANLAFLRCID